MTLRGTRSGAAGSYSYEVFFTNFFISYEVQDPEPDDNGQPGQIYKASANALIAIPSADATLPDYSVGKQVLARYPETTTFYRAVVTVVKKDVYRLKFEDDNENEMEVARRYVLDLSNK